MKNEPCTKFYSILVRTHEVLKSRSFEFSGIDVIPANVQSISPLVFFAFFVSFMEKKRPKKFYDVFDHFSRAFEVTKF